MVKKLILALAILILCDGICFAQGPGAIKTQEITSSTSLTLTSGSNGNIVMTPNGTGVVKPRNMATSVNTVTYSATPTFDASLGNIQTITLTGNVTSSTLSNAVAGQYLYFIICQDATGSRTFAWPGNFLNATTVGSTASSCTAQNFIYDGTNARGLANGGGGSSGTVTSVGMTGDGTVLNSVVPGSPITTSGTLAPTLKAYPPGYILSTGVPASGTNVAQVNSNFCTFSGVAGPNAVETCVMSNFNSGDRIVLFENCHSLGGCSTETPSDDQSSTYTRVGAFTGPKGYETGAISFSGTLTVKLTITSSNGVMDGYLLPVEISGALSADTGNTANGTVSASGTQTESFSLTTANANEGVLLIQLSRDITLSNTALTLNPSSSLTSTFSGANVWLYGAATATSYTFTGSYQIPAGQCGGGCALVLAAVAVQQNSSAVNSPPTYKPLTRAFLPASSSATILNSSRTTVGSAVNLTSATDNTVMSATLTMPNDGCPCRVMAQYSLYTTATTAITWDTWLTDGTNLFAQSQAQSADSTNQIDFPITASEISPVAYSNGQSVTFTMKLNPGTFAGGNTVQVLAAPAQPTGGIHSWLTLTVMSSVN